MSAEPARDACILRKIAEAFREWGKVAGPPGRKPEDVTEEERQLAREVLVLATSNLDVIIRLGDRYGCSQGLRGVFDFFRGLAAEHGRGGDLGAYWHRADDLSRPQLPGNVSFPDELDRWASEQEREVADGPQLSGGGADASDADSTPEQRARQIALEVGQLFCEPENRERLREWRREFEREVDDYCERFNRIEGAVRQVRETARGEHLAVLAGKTKPRLTNPHNPPAAGLEWHHHVAVIPVSTPIDRPAPGSATTTRVYGVGSWVEPEVHRRLLEGPEVPPWQSRHPSLATVAMVLSLLHDVELVEGSPLLGLPDEDSEAMAFFREDQRYDDWETYTSIGQLDDPPHRYGPKRMATVQTYLDRVKRELLSAAAFGQETPAPGQDG